MLKRTEVDHCFSMYEEALVAEIMEHGYLKSFRQGEYVLRQGSYTRVLPMVSAGRLKVYSEENEVEFLMYYLYPGQTCVFSFNHIMHDSPVSFNAISEVDSQVLCLPMDKVKQWIGQYATFALHILGAYQQQFNELLNTTKQIICYNLDERMLLYLRNQAKLTGSARIYKTHHVIALDLSTSREVISRVMKKLEKENKVIQHNRWIELLEM